MLTLRLGRNAASYVRFGLFQALQDAANKEPRLSGLKRGYGWNRIRIDRTEGARIWTGDGIFAHNPVKNSCLDPSVSPSSLPPVMPNLPVDRMIQLLRESAMRDAQTVLHNARRGLRTATGARRGQLHRALNDLDTLLQRTQRVVAQTRSRLAGVMPDAASRMVSFHDVDARAIRKGRLGKPVEFGYKAQVVDNADGSILDHSVEIGNPVDAP